MKKISAFYPNVSNVNELIMKLTDIPMLLKLSFKHTSSDIPHTSNIHLVHTCMSMFNVCPLQL